MISSTEIKLSAMNMQKVTIDLSWPPGMLNSSTDTVGRDKMDIFIKQYDQFKDNPIYKTIVKHSTFDCMLKFNKDRPPTDIIGTSVYGSSVFWKSVISQNRTGCKFELIFKNSMGENKDAKLHVYSLRNVVKPILDVDNALLTDDYIQISTVLLNGIVEHGFNEYKMNIFTPLSRVAIIDSNLPQLAQLYNVNEIDIIKMMNISSVRKAYQIRNYTTNYDPDLSASLLIRSAMSQKSNALTKQIAERQLMKIQNNTMGNLNIDKIVKTLNILTKPSGSAFDIDNIYKSSRDLNIVQLMQRMPNKESAKLLTMDIQSTDTDGSLSDKKD
uniref:Nucleocapsid protein n=1 Tax=Hymenopteran phasma-related virus OKIAV244 TaxID=2746316 RepID=A0A7D7EYZ6_9VIRU|nr:nucleocapsid protein [Hymenopteran phasma-related virus OKIAV244]